MNAALSVAVVCTLASASCQTYDLKATYLLADSYPSAKGRIREYHRSREHPFHLFQDKISYSEYALGEGRGTGFDLIRWAPDTGPRTLHTSTLTKEGPSTSRYEVVVPAMWQYPISRENRLEAIDNWIDGALRVKFRDVKQVEMNSPPG